MKHKAIKFLAAFAATIGAACVWADAIEITSWSSDWTTPGTYVFKNTVTGSDYLWVGNTDSTYASHDAWCIWQSAADADDSTIYTNGVIQSGTTSGFRIADGNGQTGRLKIESGCYKTGRYGGNIYAAFLLGGGTGSGSYWQTGGTVDTDTTWATRIGYGTGEVDFTLDGGTFNANEWMLIAQGEKSKALVKVNGGNLNVTSTFPVGFGSSSTGTLHVAGGMCIPRELCISPETMTAVSRAASRA